MSKRIYSDEMLNDFQQGSDAMSSGRLNHPDDIKKYFSSKNFKDFLADKDSPLVYCTLTLDGKPFLDKSGFSLHLGQKTNDHDSFTITVPDDALDSFQGYVMENSKNILGKNLTINLHRFGEISQVFTGIISKVKNTKENGYGILFISGSAPSILLENGQDCQSYEGKTLEQIIKEATSEYPQEAKVLVENPNTKYTIPYTVQYKESDYQFIKRLALRYGEYFYYNGQQLVFGNKVEPIVELEENIDLINVEFEMNIKPQEFNYISYDSISAQTKAKDSGSVQVQYKENLFQAIAINASKEVFKKKPDMLFNGTSHQKVETDLMEMVKRQKESRQHVMQVKGKSKNPKLKIGGRAKLIDINGKAMETYRILEITHFHDGNTYYNEFIGIPDIFISPYFNEDAFPNCEEQSAIVTNNNNGKGMIRVQFPWQKKKGLKTPWLRIVTPYAGKGKGMHMIPEVGEEVMIGFDNGNAERPFVFGAMYNGMENLGFLSTNNDIKTFTSNSGHTLLFFDGKNPSISLTDRNQNIIHINTNDDSISISSNNKIFISSDNIELTARENLILGGKHVSISAGNEMSFTSRKTTTYTDEANIDCDHLNIKANNDIVMESTGDTILKNDKTIIINNNFKNVSDENAEIDATKEITLKSKKIKHKK